MSEVCCVVTKSKIQPFLSDSPRARILALLLASCVSLCKLSNFSGLPFLLDFMGYNRIL